MTRFSPRRFSIEELCVKHGNEQAHTGHVTALALDLFDETAGFLAVPAEDRPLLEAACRLHEIGYSTSPRRHARAGYEIVRSEGLQGFTSSARDDIAAAIYLHPARPGAAADRLLERRLRASPRARRLTAYLRIADGLDAAHLQDTAIVAVRKMARTLCLPRFLARPRAGRTQGRPVAPGIPREAAVCARRSPTGRNFAPSNPRFAGR
jgi:exopolyphosphatase/pppGpp-phosphohydrolase